MSHLGSLQTRFVDIENFYLAFKKLKHHFSQGNEWYNPVELAAFEANLGTNIYKLKKEVEENNYRPHPLELLPFPKKAKKNKEAEIRQYFRPHLEDQIVWIAIVNVIGRFVEEQIPFWSYGNRMFQPVWVENEDGKDRIIRGSFSSGSSNLYRKWNQSWPFYRRHISMTIKTMGYNSRFEADILPEKERKILDQDLNEDIQYPYLKKDFWPQGEREFLYWAGMDFKNFFPSLNPANVIENLKIVLVRDDGEPRDDCALIFSTMERMLEFPVVSSGWDPAIIQKVGINTSGYFVGIPTGLVVSGFLANLAMLTVDKKNDEYIKKNRNVALFKYVDDQIVLAVSEDALRLFLDHYHTVLSTGETGAEFQEGKLEPSEGIEFSATAGFELKNPEECKLDIEFPEPLMTLSLEKMSHLNDEDYNLLDSEGLEKVETDLTHFLLADFPDSEMKRETRMAFAAMKLCQVGKQIKPNFKRLDRSLNENVAYADLLKPDNYDNEKHSKEDLYRHREQRMDQIIIKHEEIVFSEVSEKHEKIFKLLLKATKENPDKLKLWKRCVEYCYYSGLPSVDKIFEVIEDSTLHAYSKDYLRAYCTMIANQYILKGIDYLYTADISFWQAYTTRKYLLSTAYVESSYMSDKSSGFDFVRETRENYDVVSNITRSSQRWQTVFDSNNKQHTEKELFPLNIGKFYSYTYAQHCWHILDSTHGNFKLAFWKHIITKVDIWDKVSWSIASIFPACLPRDVLLNLVNNAESQGDICFERNDFAHDSSGVLYDYFFNNRSQRRVEQFPKIQTTVRHRKTSFLHIDEWLSTIKSYQHHPGWTDPRLSEWTNLEIIKQIAQAILLREEDLLGTHLGRFDHSAIAVLGNIHPANYKISKTWARSGKLSWNQWKQLVQTRPIKVEKTDLFISDYRFLPMAKFWKTNGYLWLFGSREISQIIGLAILLTKLISQTFEWPSVANKTAFIDQVYYQISQTLESQPISSETRNLLSHIFSKKNLDFFDDDKAIKLEEGITISTLKDLIRELSKIQLELEKGQLDLNNGMPRQLSYIDIDLLNVSKKIF